MKPPLKRLFTAALACLMVLAMLGCSNGSGAHEGAAEGEAHASAGETAAAAEPTAPAEPSPSPAPATPAPATPAPTPTPSPEPTHKGLVSDGWVSGIPEYMPRFSYGKLDTSRSKITEASISTVFQLRFTGVTKADVDEYCGTLRDAGYKAAAAEIGDTYTLTASKDFGWNSISLVVTLTQRNGVVTYALDAPV